MKRSKVNPPIIHCFVAIMLALVPTALLTAELPDGSETSKTKPTSEQKKSDAKIVKKNSKPPSAPARTGITRQDAKAKVAGLEKRVDQLQKDIQAAKKIKPVEQE